MNTHNIKQETERVYWEALERRVDACSHLREDGTSVIAWATQSDGKNRGVCQHCIAIFSPIKEECSSEKCWQEYQSLWALEVKRTERPPVYSTRVIPYWNPEEASLSTQDMAYKTLLSKVEKVIEFLCYGLTRYWKRRNLAYLAKVSLVQLSAVLRHPDRAKIIEQRPSKVREFVAKLQSSEQI
jgi:hypothetical protein